MRTWAAVLTLAVSAGAPACTPAVAERAAAPPAASFAETDAAPSCPRARELERSAIAAELECRLARYVQIDTTNPPGNEIAAARFLQGILESEGIPSQILESAPGRANLVARWRGRGRGKALMWMHHMDVVPAAAEEWSVAPLSGSVRDGYLWGRGSLDNKGAGMAQLVALLLLKRLGSVPERDVVLLALADEESGGAHGARWLTQEHPELFEDVAFALNEGGGIVQAGEGRVVYGVELAQKAPLWLRVTARGPSGHGSAPQPDSAAVVLVRALARLSQHRFRPRVVPEVQAMFAALAEALPEATRARYQNLEAALRDRAFWDQFSKNARHAALVQTTLAITMLAGSPKENVISERASAVLDVRLLPGQDPDVVQREIESALAEPSLELTRILSWRAHTSPRDTPLFAAIERLARRRDPGAAVTANVIGGFTDCNALRARNVTCYGFLPVRLPLAELERIHGKDERVSIEALSQAVLDLHALLEELGGDAARPSLRGAALSRDGAH